MRVFVYGTLMKSGANHRVLVDLGARLVGDATTAEPRTLVDLGPYPALLACDAERDAKASRVHGEVYELAEEAIAELDAFEGCPDLYVRERIALEEGDAFTYVLARDAPRHARAVDSGRYDGRGRILIENAREAADALDNDALNDDVSPSSPR